MISPCPWGQCEHSPNAHGLDHCHACFCVKPPPPPPGAPSEKLASRPITSEECITFGPLTVEESNAGEPQELETIEAQLCTAYSAYVEDREKHVARHERDLDRITNLVLTVSDLYRKVDRLQEQIGALDRANAEIDRQINRKPEF